MSVFKPKGGPGSRSRSAARLSPGDVSPSTPAPPINPLGPAMTTKQCADYLGFRISRMRRLIAARKIRVLRAGTASIVIYQAWADDFLRRCAVPAAHENVRQSEPQPVLMGISDLPGANRFPSARRTG